MKKLILLVIAICTICAAVSAKTIWNNASLYSPGDLNIGDILIVNISDMSKQSYSLIYGENNSFSINSIPDKNITKFLPPVSAKKDSSNKDKIEYSGKGNWNITIGSVVTAKTNDGKYTISGNKVYNINGTVNRFNIAGIVDPKLVKGRRVDSKDIAEFRLTISGYRQEIAGIDKIEPTADGYLNDEQKQKIILDYINKMLREINR